ncbi:MAG: CRISPR-associated endonuclease Cas1 [Candidatus Binatia bacterium]
MSEAADAVEVTASTKSLFSEITRLSKLYKAWDRVEANHGCAGVDGITVEKYASHLEENIGRLQKALISEKYRPLPLLRFYVDKADGGKRPLSVPAVRDRVAQTSAAIVLEPIFEAEFEDCSYAYRKGRSHLQAIQRVKQYYDQGYRWVVDVDIDAFFDEVDHEILIARLHSLIRNPQVLRLLIEWIKARIYDGKTLHSLDKGIPQGSPISPFFANLYLDLLDEAMLEKEQRIVRFSDDFLILCKDKEGAEEALELTQEVLAELKLKLDDDSELTHFDRGFQYLGATFLKSLILQKEPRRGKKKSPVVMPPLPLTLAAAVQKLPSKDAAMAKALRKALDEAGEEIMEEFYLMPSAKGKEKRESPESPVPDEKPLLRTLFIQEQGAVLEKEDERFLITKNKKVLKKVPALHVDQIIIFGSCGLTTPAMKFCLQKGIPVTLLSSRGQYYGVLESTSSSNVLIQRGQFVSSADKDFCLRLAKSIVSAKIKNSRTLLRRHMPGGETLDGLGRLLENVPGADNLDQVRGFEGAAAAKYFPAFASLLKDPMGFTHRRRQPPTDPVNSMLSFGYTLLFYNIFALIKSHGLHPYVGFFHEMRSGHPALASDLIEEFRAPVVESLVLYLINSKVLTPKDFALPKEEGLPCLLSDEARKLFIHHFEQKMNASIIHPHTNFRVDYRRCINLQVMEMARCIRGEISEYRPMEVR